MAVLSDARTAQNSPELKSHIRNMAPDMYLCVLCDCNMKEDLYQSIQEASRNVGA